MIGARCDIGALAAGTSRTLTLPFTTTTAQAATVGFVAIHVADEGASYPDSNDANNTADVLITAN